MPRLGVHQLEAFENLRRCGAAVAVLSALATCPLPVLQPDNCHNSRPPSPKHDSELCCSLQNYSCIHCHVRCAECHANALHALVCDGVWCRGLLTTPADNVDLVVNSRTYAFPNSGSVHNGFDILALDIQQGRDHGIPDYNTLRAAYGLPRVKCVGTLEGAVAAGPVRGRGGGCGSREWVLG